MCFLMPKILADNSLHWSRLCSGRYKLYVRRPLQRLETDARTARRSALPCLGARLRPAHLTHQSFRTLRGLLPGGLGTLRSCGYSTCMATDEQSTIRYVCLVVSKERLPAPPTYLSSIHGIS